jgi:alpha-glucosidase
MQWDAAPNAGFAPAGVETWLPVAEDYRAVNVAAQEGVPRSHLNTVRALLRLRRALPALHDSGVFAFVDRLPADVLAYTRERDGDRLLVVLNFGGAERTLDLAAQGARAEILLATGMDRAGAVDPGALAIRPHEGLLLRLA